jgi:hypothetical protein
MPRCEQQHWRLELRRAEYHGHTIIKLFFGNLIVR